MPLRPEEIENREFASATEGFDTHEVRAFLQRMAHEVSDWEAQLDSCRDGARREYEAAMLAETATLSEADKFGVVGDRIAAMLRQAHEAAAETDRLSEARAQELRALAESELERARAEAGHLRDEARALRAGAEELNRRAVEADAEAETRRASAEQLEAEAEAERSAAAELLARAEVDAAEMRDRAEVEGAARLDDRRAEVERLEQEIASEREAAFAEVTDARAQVSELLEEARSQSEFIKREAEEIIRTKVRTNVDAAQKRLDVLRNTEIASRNRILTAHRELEAALDRLDNEPSPAFGAEVETEVLEEAEQRSIDADYGPFFSGSDDPRHRADRPAAIDAFVVETEAPDRDVREASEEEVAAFETITPVEDRDASERGNDAQEGAAGGEPSEHGLPDPFDPSVFDSPQQLPESPDPIFDALLADGATEGDAHPDVPADPFDPSADVRDALEGVESQSPSILEDFTSQDWTAPDVGDDSGDFDADDDSDPSDWGRSVPGVHGQDDRPSPPEPPPILAPPDPFSDASGSLAGPPPPPVVPDAPVGVSGPPPEPPAHGSFEVPGPPAATDSAVPGAPDDVPEPPMPSEPRADAPAGRAESEDGLARLVREAMQRAVDNARSGPR